ncbi:MAG: hypothetical protein NW220_00905 [Leptolyngbyaceae cyanobacterium bins.349]|nr:hypothetical protein [Leptolyngbyaceae cyanobacterium bins.349]
MQTQGIAGLVVCVSVVTSVAIATVAQAGPGPRGDNRSYSNITGTNIWNSTAPIIDEDFPIDPALLTRVRQLNANATARYQECLAAIAAAEQNVPTIPPRQYLRRDPRVPYPQACTDLETLRSEADSLRGQIQKIQEAAANRSTGTW